MPDFTEDAQGVCPVCFLVHGHEVKLEIDESKRPAVRCPCPACGTANRQWDTVGEYDAWLQRNMPSILQEAEERQKALLDAEEETPEDVKSRHRLEELEDFRTWQVRKATDAGQFRVRSAWD